MPSLVPPPLTDADIHQRLIDAVLDHRLQPGTKLVEDTLGQAFGVSRTRIRQVLIRLAQEQIVTLIPNRGATMAVPTVADAREVFEARRLIEPALVQHCVARLTTADLQALARNIRDEEAARQRGDREAEIRHSGAFHLLLADRAGHTTLGRMLHGLVSRTSLVLMTFGPQPTAPLPTTRGARPLCNCDDHRALLSALKLRDADAASALMTAHLQHIEDGLVLTPQAPQEASLLTVLTRTPPPRAA